MLHFNAALVNADVLSERALRCAFATPRRRAVRTPTHTAFLPRVSFADSCEHAHVTTDVSARGPTLDGTSPRFAVRRRRNVDFVACEFALRTRGIDALSGELFVTAIAARKAVDEVHGVRLL